MVCVFIYLRLSEIRQDLVLQYFSCLLLWKVLICSSMVLTGARPHSYPFLYIVLIQCLLRYSRLLGSSGCLTLRILGVCDGAIAVAPIRILTTPWDPLSELGSWLNNDLYRCFLSLLFVLFSCSLGILCFVTRYFNQTTLSFTCCLIYLINQYTPQ